MRDIDRHIRQRLSSSQGAVLIALAREAITSALVPEPVSREPALHQMPSALLEQRSSFVTLRTAEALRGCCGSLDATRALALDVWHSARAAAFRDSRFERLRAEELQALAIEVSVLTPLRPLPVASEAELLEYLLTAREGLLLSCGTRRATFLPKVWESLPDPADFVRQLKLKAGLSPDSWPQQIEWSCYRTQCFEADFVAKGPV